ncbi:hypothetical protein GQ464_000585 [Rhodocaloribacter litoris]|uniref:hypothetical protein n=1 Tax=Rhodocaloribacter litoris TaxID=2558931 RepID=UPI00141EA2E9|nr:hypothetical protein [Rhodocaloribacter litoris]QXD15484.1 hypothetical protein GQ464_000585 [Rhodocaloribacter litoris]
MQPFDPLPEPEDDLIERYLDGDLSPGAAAALERRLADAGRSEVLRLAERIRDDLRTLPVPSCPPHVTRAVLQAARQRARRDRRRHGHPQDRRCTWQPVLAMVLLLGLALVAALIGRPAQPSPDDPAIQRALVEVKWTLALVSEVGRQTGASVSRAMLGPRTDLPRDAAEPSKTP